MGSILSAISGQFTRSLILGAFFPVVLFVVLGLLTVQPLLPAGVPVLQPFQQLETQWQALAVTFIAVVLAGILYNLNIPIVRFYEGYPWRDSTIGKWRTERFRLRFEEMSALIQRMRMVRDGLRGFAGKEASVRNLQAQMDPLGRELNDAYPHAAAYVLPTRLGNIIRSFETYPSRQYGMDGVTLWPRLAAVASKEVTEAAADARSTVDFFINCSVLSALLAALIFGIGLWKTSDRMPTSTLILWPVEALAAAAFSYLFYLGAAAQAASWGASVRTAFDLHRQDLLKKLGYQDTPKNRAEERALWITISQQILYGDPPFKAPREYNAPEPARTVVTTTPSAINVEISAGVDPGPLKMLGRALRRTYVVRHASPDGFAAATVSLTETLPAEESYVWGSARVNGVPMNPTGTNPLIFDLGPLAVGGTVELVYLSLHDSR